MNVASSCFSQNSERETLLAHSKTRQRLHQVVLHDHFETVLGLLIALNFVVIIIETNEGAPCAREAYNECIPPWMAWANYWFLLLYTGEAIVRIYVFRLNYFTSRWDLFDFAIVVTGYLEVIIGLLAATALPALQMLRLFRVARLMRVPRMMRMFPELYAMIRGFFSAMSAMMWGCIMILLILLMWSVLAVELLNPINMAFYDDDHFCSSAFSSVFSAILIFFQTLVAGDSWGECSIALIRHAPASFIIFAGSLMTIQLGFTNLILAVVVERASEAHEQEKHSEMLERYNRRQEAEANLKLMCQEIDTNEDGRLTMQDLMSAYEEHEELRSCLHSLDLDQGDLECLFQLMDIDDSGELTYEDLITCIHRSDNNDLNLQMMMMKLQMEDVWVRVREHLQESVDVIIAKLEANLPKTAKQHRPSARGRLRRTMLLSRSSLWSTPKHDVPPNHMEQPGSMPCLIHGQRHLESKQALRSLLQKEGRESRPVPHAPMDLETAGALAGEALQQEKNKPEPLEEDPSSLHSDLPGSLASPELAE